MGRSDGSPRATPHKVRDLKCDWQLLAGSILLVTGRAALWQGFEPQPEPVRRSNSNDLPPSAQGPHSNTQYVQQMPHKPKDMCKPVLCRNARLARCRSRRSPRNSLGCTPAARRKHAADTSAHWLARLRRSGRTAAGGSTSSALRFRPRGSRTTRLAERKEAASETRLASLPPARPDGCRSTRGLPCYGRALPCGYDRFPA